MNTVRLLIIDDNEADRWLYKRYLNRQAEGAYEFTESESGNDGIAMFKRQKPDCVLLDYFLSDMEGADVLHAIMAEDVKARVIILTGQCDPAVEDKLLKLGAVKYMPKDSIDPTTLHEAITSVLA